MKRICPGFHLLPLVGLALLFLPACTRPSPTAGGQETNQAILDLGLQQFSHLHGWQGGDPRRIDTPEEINFSFWTAFWKLDYVQQLTVFQSLDWPAVHAFCKYGVDKWEINEAGSSLAPAVQQERFRQIIRLLDARYALGIGVNTDLPGMRFVIRSTGKPDTSGSVAILQYFVPRGRMEKEAGQTCTRQVIYEGKVDVFRDQPLDLSKDEQRQVMILFP